MIGWEDVYNVVVAMLPLYVALGLGYGSVKWWGMFKPDQCDAINRFNCYFIIPFFTFQFTAGVDPYSMNYGFLAGDVVAKAIVGSALAIWANLWRNGELSWAITSFSLSSLNNTLVVGVPLLKAMYGATGADLVIQSSVIQSLLWLPTLLFLLEFRRTYRIDIDPTTTNTPNNIHYDREAATTTIASKTTLNTHQDDSVLTSIEIVAIDRNNNNNNNNTKQLPPPQLEDNNKYANQVAAGLSLNIAAAAAIENRISSSSSSPMIFLSPHFRTTMKKVCAKLAKNPNSYACALGLIWALLAKRWHLQMPSMVEGSILIMAKAGSGVAMFSMGLFMALQEKVIACGVRLTLYSMVMRFLAGPLTTMVGSLAFGLRSDVLRIAIIQGALPQSIASFVFAQEYGLHANVLSTSVIFGTIVSLPLLIAYYAILDVLR